MFEETWGMISGYEELWKVLNHFPGAKKKFRGTGGHITLIGFWLEKFLGQL